MRKQQISFCLEKPIVELIKKSCKENGESLSDHIRQIVLERVLKERPDLVAWEDPHTKRITEVWGEKASKNFNKSMREAEKEFEEGTLLSFDTPEESLAYIKNI